MNYLRKFDRIIAVAFLLLVLSLFLTSCVSDKNKQDEIKYFHSAVSALSDYNSWRIEDDLSVIRWYLDDSGDYDEITRADAQEAYKGLESHLKDLDAALRDFVSEYKDYTW